MKVLVAGKGFIGEAIGDELETFYDVKYLDRSTGDYREDVTQSFEIDEEFDVLIHTIGLAPGFATEEAYQQVHVEGTGNMLEGVECEKVVYLSALGVGEVDHSFFRTKEKAEELIRESGKDYSIVRPSTVYGQGNKLLELMKRFAPTRIFPDLPAETQPILRDDLVSVVLETVESFDNETLDAAGPEKYSMGELATEMYREEGYRCFLLPAPKSLMRFGLRTLSFLGPPFRPENIKIFTSSNTTDENDAENLVELSEIFKK
ncbi:MAG: SDR family oxidoreductase [Candidatus Nanohalobium sp.]